MEVLVVLVVVLVVEESSQKRQTGRQAGTHAVMLGRGLIDLLHGHCCCKSLTHLRQMDGECVRGYD